MFLYLISVPCDSSPCQNGGTCEWDASGRYTCSCIQGFRGMNCEEGKYHYVVFTLSICIEISTIRFHDQSMSYFC